LSFLGWADIVDKLIGSFGEPSVSDSRFFKPPRMTDPDFAAALAAHGYELTDTQAERIEAYVKLLWHWNESINLTRHTTWDLFVGRDLRDCLELASLIDPGEDVLDLGSGGGVPGIPLAILRPDVRVSLSESVGKRAKVLDEIVSELHLPVAVYEARGQELLFDFRFTTLVSRAVGSLMKLVQWVEPHWESLDRMLVIKGPKWVQERGEARHHGVLSGVNLRVAKSYPLGGSTVEQIGDSAGDATGEEASEGVILQIWPRGRELPAKLGTFVDSGPQGGAATEKIVDSPDESVSDSAGEENDVS